MKRNMNETDRIVRTSLAIVIAILIWTEVLKGALGLILGALGVVLLLTSFFRFCPLYALFKISTTPRPRS